MAFSQATLIQRVRDLLQDNPWTTPFTVNLASATTTTVTVSDGTRWEEGAILEFQDNGEQCYVSSVSGNNLTCIRGFNGTTATTHNGSVTAIPITRDPTFSYKRIVDSIELTIQSLFPYVYKKVTTTVTPVNGTTWYNLAADAIGLIAVAQLSSTTPYTFYRYGLKGTRRPVAFELNVPTTLAASGAAIGFPRGFATTATSVQVDYAAKLTATIQTSNYSDLSDGIQAECVAYGAAARLVIQQDIQRVTTEDINMGDSSVQPGARSGIGRAIQQEHVRLRTIWQEELRRTIPMFGRSNYALTSTGISSNYIGSTQPF